MKASDKASMLSQTHICTAFCSGDGEKKGFSIVNINRDLTKFNGTRFRVDMLPFDDPILLVF